MSYAKVLKIYDDYLPSTLAKLRGYYESVDRDDDEDSEFFREAMARENVRMAKESDPGRHSDTLTIENLNAIDEDQFARDAVLDDIAAQLLKHLSGDEWRKLLGMSLGDYIGGSEDDEMSAARYVLDEALKDRAVSAQSTEMPELLYRGAKDGDFEVTGFEGAEEAHGDKPDASPHGRVVFVSSEPSVAASYARRDKFQRGGVTPTNYGDTIYQIRTAGLDPALFLPDRSSTADELLFGPQYRYNAPIKQEMVTIKDAAGNERTVPRIEKVPYLSDALCKDVYAPAHILDAVRRRM